MKIKSARRITQISTIALIIAIPLLNKNGITVLTGTLYSLAIGPIWITDPLIGAQTILTTLTADTTLLLSMLIPIIITLSLGRVICGWICPQNTLSELFDRLSQKFKLRRLVNPATSAWPRYIILVLLLIAIPITGIPLASLLSAPGIISVQASKYIIEGLVGLELALIGLIILFELFVIRRAWCNYVCPVGSFLGLFRVKRDIVVFMENGGHVCGKCMECVQACQLGLNPMRGKIYPLCHNCGDCIDACKEMKPGSNPLLFRF